MQTLAFLTGEKFPIIKEEITQEDVTAFDHFDNIDSKKVTKSQLFGGLKSEFDQNGLDAALDDLMDVDDGGGGSDYEGQGLTYASKICDNKCYGHFSNTI